MHGRGPIDKTTRTTPPPANGTGGRTPFDPKHYMRLASGVIVSKFFQRPMRDPLHSICTISPLIEAHSLDDIQLGNIPVADEMGEPFFGIKNNLYFPEYNLYVINTDNLTFFALAEAAKRGDIELEASIFTFDAHADIVPLQAAAIPPWHKGNVRDYAQCAVNITPLQQLQAALKLGLIKRQGIHLISPDSLTPGINEEPLLFPGQAEILGKQYVYPHFPLEVFDSLSKKQREAHVDIDFHSEDFGKTMNDMMQDPAKLNAGSFMSALLAEPERVAPQKIEAFRTWVRRTEFFKKAGLRIICVSPNIVHPEDVIWLTREHVKLVMEEGKE